MRKKKASIHKKTHKRSRVLSLKEKLFFGLEGGFIIIFGGGFLVIALGIMLFIR
jgi:hypothetical protein